MKIGEQLQRQRKLHQMSQDELADKLGISRQAISRWENGATLPSFYNVLAISDLFHISLDELIRGDELLMEKLENSNQKKEPFLQTGKGILTVSLILAAAVWIIARSLKFYGSANFKFYYWLVTLFGFGGLLMNLEWKGVIREIKRNVNRKTIIWIIIILTAYLIPRFDIFLGDMF